MNREEYKKSMSGVRPSEEAIERIMDMTEKKSNTKLVLKRLAASTLALALMIGGGIGANQLLNKNTDEPISIVQTQNKINPLSVMVAYAEEGEVKQKPVELGVDMPFEYILQIYDIRDKSEKDIETLKDQLHNENLDKKFNSGVFEIKTSTETLDNIILRKVISNAFVLDIKDPTNVKSINLKTGTDYWYLNYRDRREGVDLENAFPKGQNLTISGKDYAEMINANQECGYSNLSINLEHDMNMCSQIDKNPNINLSAFDDTLTFTVIYNDGTVEESNIDISLNDNGILMIKMK